MTDEQFEARDIRFAGTHPRLLRVAVALGVDVSAHDARTLPAAVADAIDANGDSGDALRLLADMLRDSADVQRPAPARLSIDEAKKRQRLQLLASALALMRWTHGRCGKTWQTVGHFGAVDDDAERLIPADRGDGSADPAYARPHAIPVRSIAGVFRDIALMEGVAVSNLRQRSASIKRWCVTDPEAKAMIASLRPVKAASAPRKARRGLGRTQPIGDAGTALQSAWK